MARKCYTAEQIIGFLRQAEVMVAMWLMMSGLIIIVQQLMK